MKNEYLVFLEASFYPAGSSILLNEEADFQFPYKDGVVVKNGKLDGGEIWDFMTMEKLDVCQKMNLYLFDEDVLFISIDSTFPLKEYFYFEDDSLGEEFYVSGLNEILKNNAENIERDALSLIEKEKQNGNKEDITIIFPTIWSMEELDDVKLNPCYEGLYILKR
jgi:hypothetical protein